MADPTSNGETNVAQKGGTNPFVVGWMVGSSDSPAMYNLHERERAFEAAKRWNAPIVELIVNPSVAAALSGDGSVVETFGDGDSK